MRYFAPLSTRLKAVLLDGVFLALWVFLVVISVTYLEINNPLYESLLVFLILVSVEPMLVSFLGGSAGQIFFGIEVLSAADGKRIGLLTSYLRYLVKLPLGILSLITITATEKYQGIHDLLARTLVVHRHSDQVPYHARLIQRPGPDANYIYPPLWRRILVVVIYLLLSFVMLGVGTVLLLSDGCLTYGRCTVVESVVSVTLSLLFYISLFALPALGSKSALWGCRKTKKLA